MWSIHYSNRTSLSPFFPQSRAPFWFSNLSILRRVIFVGYPIDRMATIIADFSVPPCRRRAVIRTAEGANRIGGNTEIGRRSVRDRRANVNYRVRKNSREQWPGTVDESGNPAAIGKVNFTVKSFHISVTLVRRSLYTPTGQIGLLGRRARALYGEVVGEGVGGGCKRGARRKCFAKRVWHGDWGVH